MKLHDLQPNDGATKERKRVGHGVSAGQGKTCGRGTKGQGSRRGTGGHLTHQGGNLPYYRHLPFIRGEGFTPPNRVEYAEINVDQLAELPAKSEVSPEKLAEMGWLRKADQPVAVLGRGELSVALTVRVHRISKSAREKIEKAGGTVEIIG